MEKKLSSKHNDAKEHKWKCSCSAFLHSLCMLRYFVLIFLRNKRVNQPNKIQGMFYYLIVMHVKKFWHFWRKKKFTRKSLLCQSCIKISSQKTFLISIWTMCHTVQEVIVLVISNWHRALHWTDFEITSAITPWIALHLVQSVLLIVLIISNWPHALHFLNHLRDYPLIVSTWTSCHTIQGVLVLVI